MYEIKIYRELFVMTIKYDEKLELSFQNWHEEFDKFWPNHSKISKIRTLMGSFWWKYIFVFEPGVVACTCNPATLEAEFRNRVGSIPVGGNSPLIGGWIVWPPVIQH